MIYIIGGVTRSGKSILARELNKKHGLPYFNLDHIMMAMLNSEKDFGFNMNSHDEEKSEKAWQFVLPFMKSLIESEKDYIVEGALLTPKQANVLGGLKKEIAFCWLGYADISVQQKFENIRNFKAESRDWLNEKDDAFVKMIAEYGITQSKQLKNICEEIGIPFVDTSQGFEQAIQKAEAILIKNK